MEELKKQPEQIPAEDIDTLKEQIATLTKERDGVVGEIQEDRKKRQEMQTEIDDLKGLLEAATKANQVPNNQTDTNAAIAEAIEQKLRERDASVAKGNKSTAIERFVSENKAYHPENDPTGKKREALEEAIKRFNTEGLNSVEQFYNVARDAARLLGEDTAPANPSDVEIQDTGHVSNQTPRVATDGDVSPEEKRLYESNGWTKEKYLTLKSKQPDFIYQLLNAIGKPY